VDVCRTAVLPQLIWIDLARSYDWRRCRLRKRVLAPVRVRLSSQHNSGIHELRARHENFGRCRLLYYCTHTSPRSQVLYIPWPPCELPLPKTPSAP
jgi:hypothetical protein